MAKPEYRLERRKEGVILYEATILQSMPWVAIGTFVDEASAIACMRSMCAARKGASNV